tara:strand:- start:852 stop:1679 length:828 start_codon:yes stop_codon:yes gene_type:complete
MKLQVGIIGNSIKHTLSPLIQNIALNSHNIDAQYQVWDVSLVDLKNHINSLKGENVLGANVTIPYKEEVIPMLDSLSEVAKTIGAVNTIINHNGVLHGDNTDSDGFIKDITKRHNIKISGTKTLVLGAGGASKAIIYGLLKHQAKSVTIVNRTREKADIIVSKFQHLGLIKSTSFNLIELGNLDQFDLIINCTSFGMKHSSLEGKFPIPKNLINQCKIFYDLVYNPLITPIVQEVQNSGGVGINGLGMLIEQGAISFELWTGLKAPNELMFSAIK